jgi:DNA-binding transcriptional MerR regulator
MQFTPTKLYYKIGEVCEILGVEAYVLRYWESEFSCLSPPKNKAGQRTYRPKDIELLLEIKKLLYEDGFTIAGARKQLASAVPRPVRTAARASRPSGGKQRRANAVSGDPKPRAQQLRQVRAELENILTLLERE